MQLDRPAAMLIRLPKIGGFAGPYVISYLNERTHSLTASFGFIALAYVAAGTLVLLLRVHSPREEAKIGSKKLRRKRLS